MKRLTITLVAAVLFLQNTISAQEAGDRKLQFGLQTNLFGLHLYGEKPIGSHWALRTELGTNLGASRNSLFVAPKVSIIPRYYFNLKPQEESIQANNTKTAMFLGVQASYSKALHVSREVLISPANGFELMPTIGLRHNFNYQWHIEAGFGHGFWFIDKPSTLPNRVVQISDIRLRLGYRF
jgi:hypothetical protein